MKVYISADIEGISGLVSWSQCGRPNSDHFDYRWARERMTADVNAAIRGAKAAGATEILVKDSHGNSKNLLADQLERGARLISGYGARHGGMMIGIDRECTATLLVGYHAMAGTGGGVMEHTITGYVHRMWINEMPAGEIALSAGIAGCYECPVVMISSDMAGCQEAKQLLPDIKTAAVKEGFGRYMADCMHPHDAAELIEETARQGVEHASEMDPWVPKVPGAVRIEFNRTEEADSALKLIGVRRVDGYTVEYHADSYAALHQAAWQMILFADLGHRADT